MNILRIDNGWGLEDGNGNESEPPLTLHNTRKQQAIQSIQYDFNLENNREKLIAAYTVMCSGPITESYLYDLLYNSGSRRTLINWGVSRHIFHLFLRACTSNESLFRLVRMLFPVFQLTRMLDVFYSIMIKRLTMSILQTTTGWYGRGCR